MDLSTKVALIGDFHESVVAHRAIPLALALCQAEGVWLHTSLLGTDVAKQLNEFAGVWCVPASPYANMQGALDAIRFAPESGKPFLGTCGGFQHAIVEYARNVLDIADADHAETNPLASALLIAPLVCPLVEETQELVLQAGSRIRQAYGGEERIREAYHCSFGLNRDFEARLFAGNRLRATAHDQNGEVRAVELQEHRFFVATLFQPERRALEANRDRLCDLPLAQEASTPSPLFASSSEASAGPDGPPKEQKLGSTASSGSVAQASPLEAQRVRTGAPSIDPGTFGAAPVSHQFIKGIAPP